MVSQKGSTQSSGVTIEDRCVAVMRLSLSAIISDVFRDAVDPFAYPQIIPQFLRLWQTH